MNKLPIKLPLIIFSLLALVLRLLYFKIDDTLGVRVLDILTITILISSLILFTLTIIRATKKDFKPLIIFIIIICTLYFFPFEYLTSWTEFRFNNNERKELIGNLNNGTYDSIISREEYPENGVWIESHNPRFKIFKDSSLQMLFIWQGYIRTQEEYCGQLYLSDAKQIDDVKVNKFIGREFHKTYLGDSWYWIDCYIDRTPGP